MAGITIKEATEKIEKAPKKSTPTNATLALEVANSDKYRGNLIYIKELDSLFVWIDGKYYRPVDSTTMYHDTWNYIFKNHPQVRLTGSMVKDIMAVLPAAINQTHDSIDDHYLSLNDTLIDTDTFEQLPHHASRVATLHFPYTYAEVQEAECPVFMKFLESILVQEDNTTAPDYELITVIQELVGYLLSPRMDASVAFFFVGGGANGKSTLTNLLSKLLGRDYISAFSIESLTAARSFTVAGIIGKRVNICSEEESKYIRSDKFKAMVSGEMISAERKFGQAFEFCPTTKFLFCTNSMPSFDGANYGLKRRVKVVPFFRQFENHEQDKQLGKKLLAETPGIIRWALEGLERLHRNNYVFSDAQSAAMRETAIRFVAEISSPVRFFQERYEVSEDTVACNEIYQDFRRWCEMNGSKPVTSMTFYKELAANLNIKSFVKWDNGSATRSYNCSLMGPPLPPKQPHQSHYSDNPF